MAPYQARQPQAPWIQLALWTGVALVLASLLVLDWVGGPGNGRLIDLKRALDGATGSDQLERLAGYTEWMPWAMGAICAITAVTAVLSHKRMKTATRVIAMVVLVQFLALPVAIVLMMGSSATTVDGTRTDDSGNVGAAIVVLAGGVAVALVLSYIPAHIAAVLAAVIGGIGQLVAWSDLSEISADPQAGVPALLAGYALLAAAAFGSRLLRRPQLPAGAPQGMYGPLPGMPGPYGMPYRP